MLVFVLVTVIVLLVLSWGVNKWLDSKIAEENSSYKSLYNFTTKLCFTFKDCPNDDIKCKYCLQPTKVIFKLGTFKIIVICIYNMYNGIPDINLTKLQEYLGIYDYRIVTKFTNGNKSFVKNGIIYDGHAAYTNAQVLVYFDDRNCNFNINYLNNSYNKGIPVSKLLLDSKF